MIRESMEAVMNYTQAMPDYGDAIPLAEWNEAVADGSFIPYDGTGYWMRDGLYDRSADAFSPAPPDATHVAWFNR
jgi:hypothetical protein